MIFLTEKETKDFMNKNFDELKDILMIKIDNKVSKQQMDLLGWYRNYGKITEPFKNKIQKMSELLNQKYFKYFYKFNDFEFEYKTCIWAFKLENNVTCILYLSPKGLTIETNCNSEDKIKDTINIMVKYLLP